MSVWTIVGWLMAITLALHLVSVAMKVVGRLLLAWDRWEREREAKNVPVDPWRNRR